MKKFICKCDTNIKKCVIPRPFFIHPNEVPKSYANTNRLHSKFTKQYWSHALYLRTISSKKAEYWIQKNIINSSKSSKSMHINALVAHLLLDRAYFENIKQLKIEELEIKKHFEYQIISKIINIEIISNNFDLTQLYFETDDTEFKNMYKKYLKKPTGIFEATLYTKTPKSSKYNCIGSFILDQKPEVSKETNKKIYAATKSLSQINNIDFIDKNKMLLTKNDLQKSFEKWSKLSKKELDEIIKKLIHKPVEKITQETRKHEIQKRNKIKRNFALFYSKGYCLNCDNVAPFFNQNNSIPYLEIDHLKELSKFGQDEITNMVALCPNCHRKKTHWDDVQGKKILIKNLTQKVKDFYK